MILLEGTMVQFWQIFAISFGMAVLNLIFSVIFRLDPKEQMDIQTKMQDLQEQMKLAQTRPELMQQYQAEMMQLTRNMTKKQMIPMCIRSVVYMGIFALVGGLYRQYDEGLFFQYIL